MISFAAMLNARAVEAVISLLRFSGAKQAHQNQDQELQMFRVYYRDLELSPFCHVLFFFADILSSPLLSLVFTIPSLLCLSYPSLHSLCRPTSLSIIALLLLLPRGIIPSISLEKYIRQKLAILRWYTSGAHHLHQNYIPIHPGTHPEAYLKIKMSDQLRNGRTS